MAKIDTLRFAVVERAIEECHQGNGASDELTRAVIAYLRADGPDEMADDLEAAQFGDEP